MKLAPRINILFFGIVLFLLVSFKPGGKITRQEAIKLAEDFVKKNGYTAEPADKSTLSYELMDRLTERDGDSVILKGRSNTLQPKAFCITETDRWDIGFLSTRVNLQRLDSLQLQSDLSGRAVIVSLDGKEIRMAHKDPLFSHFTKL
jgi:hypothetical protein